MSLRLTLELASTTRNSLIYVNEPGADVQGVFTLESTAFEAEVPPKKIFVAIDKG